LLGTPNDTSDGNRRILIVGASVRAAAESAVRAGWSPLCADLFCDEDLIDVADVIPLSTYPEGLIDAAHSAPESPWMYTGGVENHPRILNSISDERSLWGNSSSAVEIVRDLFTVRELLTTADLPAIEVRPASSPPSGKGWLIKPFRGTGGRGIHNWTESTAIAAECNGQSYFQRYVEGDAFSALFLAVASESNTADAELIGVTRQLIGEPTLNAPLAFAYCGSIGPLALPHSATDTIRRIGSRLAAEAGLVGLFGIDLIMDSAGIPWLTEVNPRYTASVEVFERAWNMSLFRWHAQACEKSDSVHDLLAQIRDELSARPAAFSGPVVGKAVLFAGRDITVGRLPPSLDEIRSKASLRTLADRPSGGMLIRCGQPICTVLVDAVDETQCRNRLLADAQRTYAFIEERATTETTIF